MINENDGDDGPVLEANAGAEAEAAPDSISASSTSVPAAAMLHVAALEDALARHGVDAAVRQRRGHAGHGAARDGERALPGVKVEVAEQRLPRRDEARREGAHLLEHEA